MKKTIIALLSLGGLSSAAITDGLQWAESFGDGYSQAATFNMNNAFHVEDGVGIAGGDYTDSRIWTTNTWSKPVVGNGTTQNPEFPSKALFTNAFTFNLHGIDCVSD